jgi:phospholipid transport system substrate-binding protein
MKKQIGGNSTVAYSSWAYHLQVGSTGHGENPLRNLIYGAASLLLLTGLLANSPAHASGSPNSEPESARHLVDGFHASLLTVMKQAKKMTVLARYRVLEPEINKRFDLRLMIALASGKHWRSADKNSRKRLTEAFRKFSTATYASRFSGYSGQSFQTLKVSAGPRKTELVGTEIRRPDDKPVALTYVTRKASKGWRIIDVLVDNGISELAVRRSEYRSVLKSGGVSGLIQLLDQNTEKLLKN